MKNIFFAIICIVSINARALFSFEPYLGMTSGTLDTSSSTSNGVSLSDSKNITDLAYGLKFGVDLFGVNTGFDYIATGDINMLAFYASVAIPAIPVSLQGRTMLSTGLELASAYNEDKNSGYGFGIALTFFPMFNINIDYNVLELRGSTDNLLNDSSNVSAETKADYSEILVTLGFPF